MVDDVDAVLEQGDWGPAVADLLLAAGYPWTPEGWRWLMRSPVWHGLCPADGLLALRLRLEVVETDACRKFHADQLCARLLCTFPDREHSGSRPEAVRQVRQMAIGEVGIFKGRLWAEEPSILHRSPPIAALGDAPVAGP
jgi:hypothetical protein